MAARRVEEGAGTDVEMAAPSLGAVSSQGMAHLLEGRHVSPVCHVPGHPQSLPITGLGPAGPNTYLATFDRGSLEWRVWLTPDGSVDVFRYRNASQKWMGSQGVARDRPWSSDCITGHA